MVNKRSFILYSDLIHTVNKMPTEKAGELFVTILRYVNDENPVVNDLLIEIAFEPIKQQLKRDLNRWEGIKDKRSEAGKASAEARKIAKEKEQKPANSTHVESVQQTSTHSTVNVNGNVSVNVNDNVNVIRESKESPPPKIDLSLTKKIMDWFGFTETANYDKMRRVGEFQRCLVAQERLEYFEVQLPAYMEFKNLDPRYKHSFDKFIGSPEFLYVDGQWNAENWIEKLKIEKTKSNGKSDQTNYGRRSNQSPVTTAGYSKL